MPFTDYCALQNEGDNDVEAPDRDVDMPPSYEDAIKFPSISSLLSSSTAASRTVGGVANHACMSTDDVATTDVHEATSSRQSAKRKPSFVRSLSCGDLAKTPPPFDEVVHHS